MTQATAADGAAIYYETHGSGTPVILSAGMGGGGGFWAPQIAALAERYKVIVYDHVGTARSRGEKPIARSIAGMADDIVSVLDHAGEDAAHVVGHAIGGIVGLELAMSQPQRARSVTVVNGWGRADAFLRRCFEVRKEILKSSGPRAYVRAQPLFLFPPQWIAENVAKIEAEEPHMVSHFPPAETINARIEMFLAFDPGEKLKTITTPVLVTTAADDALVPAYLTRELAAAIPGATLREVSYGAHAFTAVTPDVFNTMLLEFPVASAADPLRLRTPQDFAESLAVHVNYLNRSVKEITGKPISNHIAERIASEAKALLQHTSWSVADIAFALGFEYPSYFNNYFKRITDITPNAFRKNKEKV